MSQLFNPATRTISKTVPRTNPPSLQTLCRNVILQAVTLKRLKQADELLPLPRPLRRTVSVLNLQDFFIDAELIAAGNHEKQSYPAKCVFDGKPCVLKVKPKGSNPDVNNPSYIVSFEDCDTVCCVYEKTDSLFDKVQENKQQGRTFQESFIWKTVKGLLEFMLNGKITTSTKINSSLIQFYGTEGVLFIEKEDESMTQVQMSPDSAIYEAPEVLRREDPTEQSFSWTLGCIIYEMLALEPAFYDRTGTNPFQVFMDMMQGNLPPEPPDGSAGLKSVMWNCLKLNPTERISPQELLGHAKSH